MRIILIVSFIALCVNLPAQEIKLGHKGVIDIAYVYNDAYSYIKVPKERTFPLTTRYSILSDGVEREPGLYNVSSAALQVRIWTVLDQIFMKSSFVFKLADKLIGEGAMIEYDRISKYPDLVKRFNAIKPTSVKAIVGMGLNKEDEYSGGAYAFFLIPEKEILITHAGKSTYVSLPSQESWGESVIMLTKDESYLYTFKDFPEYKNTDAGKEKMLNILNNTTRVAPYGWIKVSQGTVRKRYPSNGQNIRIQIKWPESEIKKIGELYEKYERGEEVPPLEEVAKAMADKNLDTYNEGDEWSEPFEDDLKGVEAFYDYKGQVLGLKTKDRTIITFDWDEYSNIHALANTPYFLLTSRKDNKIFIVDKRGNKQMIGGKQSFDQVYSSNGEVMAEIKLSPDEYVARVSDGLNLTKMRGFYISASEARGAIQNAVNAKEKREKEEYEKRKSSGSSTSTEVYISMSYNYYVGHLVRYTTDTQLKIKSTDRGYIVK